MGKKTKNRFYAYVTAQKRGIVSSWSECESIVSGRKARYKGFPDRRSAEQWLAGGGSYASPKGKKLYAYAFGREQGIVTSWAECERIVDGHKARYKSFPDRKSAELWLAGGARYEDKNAAKKVALAEYPESAVFFDSGTGAGRGAEIRVTDREKVPILHLAGDLLPGTVTVEGNIVLGRAKTNNYGELLACRLAMAIASKLGSKHIFGDSRLVLDYWSKGRVSKEKAAQDPALVALAKETAKARRLFEAEGGKLDHVPGGINPADLGFHRD